MPPRPTNPARHDAPAALPLVAYLGGLAAGPMLLEPALTAAAIAMCGVLSMRFGRRIALAAVFLATGLAIAGRVKTAGDREKAAFEAIDAARFVRIDAPLTSGWSPRGEAFVLRTKSFTASGVTFMRPLLIYSRIEPPPIGMWKSVRVEGFLRRSDRGAYTCAVKSVRLIQYGRRLRRWEPQRWNRALAARIDPLSADHADAVALVQAVALGRSERLRDGTKESFRRGGTYHLLVFSGLQITAAAAAIAWLLRSHGLQRGSDWLLLAFSILAPLFIDHSAAVSRASVAIGAYAVSRILRRPTSLENLWCVAALLRLIAAPGDLFEAGFQLTYGGAGALLFIARHAGDRRWRWLGGAMAAELVVTPLTLAHFHQFALGGSVLTLLLAPLVLAILVLAVPLFALPVEAMILPIELLHGVCTSLNEAGAIGSGFFTAPPPAALFAGFGGALAAIAAWPGKRRAVAISLALAVPSLAAIVRAHALRAVRHPEVVVLDVGQGDAILLRDGSHAVLVDGGGRFDQPRFGESTLLPLLVERGVFHIDSVVLTHAHPDHCGGLQAVIEHLRAGELRVSPRRLRGPCATRLLEAARQRKVAIRPIRDGDLLVAGNIRARAMVAIRRFKRSPENNTSVVLRVTLGGRRVLLTGDIERDAETVLVDRDLHADVLKIAHHGSRSSSTPMFLDSVGARVALISAGRNNLFGHPHATVLEALRNRGIVTRQTSVHGTIAVVLPPRKLLLRTEIDTPP